MLRIKSHIALLVTFLCLNTNIYAYFWPTACDWRDSFIQAAESPITWGPLLGAALIVATHSDERISNWASSNTPVYGSQDNAKHVSTVINDSLEIMALGTLILMPKKNDDMNWFVEKGAYFLVEGVAVAVPSGVTDILKSTFKRTRPNGYSQNSFPSGHSTTAFATAAITARNLDDFNITPATRWIAKASVYTLAVGAGWGRIEGKAHYPTDVLVGAAIGNFFASGIYNAFMNAGSKLPIEVSFTPLDGGGMSFNVEKNF